MAFTEFCCRSGGSQLNAGTRTGNSTEPGTTAFYTNTGGSFATNTFTTNASDPSAAGVAAGDFAQVSDGASIGRIARITSVTSTTIVLSATASITVNAGTYTEIRVGGAWAGPSGTDGFPLANITTVLTNATGNLPRINLKNDQTYSISSGITNNNSGPLSVRGYTTAYGDLGRAQIDGSTNAIALFSTTGFRWSFTDMIFANNGASGSNAGLTVAARGMVVRCVAKNLRGFGFVLGTDGSAIECEAFDCNQSNTANLGGFSNGKLIRCISHDNSGGANAHGFMDPLSMFSCIADTNGGSGVKFNSTAASVIQGCDFYANSGDGVLLAAGSSTVEIENCNFIKNTGWGFSVTGASTITLLQNCGFGAGTQVNGSGATNYANASCVSEEIGTVNYASNAVPYVDPANGDFRISLAASEGTGRGTFTQTATSYAGAVGYPDIGAAQHQDAGGSGGFPVLGGPFT